MQCPSCGTTNFPGADQCDDCHASLMQEDLPGARPRTRLEAGLLEETVTTLAPRAGITIREDAALGEAVGLMQRELIGCLLVTDEQDRLRGIFSERDVLYKCVGQGVDFETARVNEYMTREPETVRLDNPLAYALQRMMVGGYRHLPLVDSEGRPAGMISSRDIVNRVGAQLPRSL